MYTDDANIRKLIEEEKNKKPAAYHGLTDNEKKWVETRGPRLKLNKTSYIYQKSIYFGKIAHKLANEERKKHNRPLRVWNDDLHDACFNHSVNAIHDPKGRFGWPHRAIWVRYWYMHNLGYKLGRGYPSENVAIAGYPSQTIKLWMNSPSHKRSILRPRDNVEGISYVFRVRKFPIITLMALRIHNYDPKENIDKPPIPKNLN